MKYYKDTNGEVFAYESDGSQDSYIAPSLVLMNQTEIDLHLNPPPVVVAPVTPTKISLSQAKIALSRSGYLTQVDTALNALTEPQKTEALIAWNSSNEVLRSSQLVTAMQASLGLTTAQMDDLFTLANSINP